MKNLSIILLLICTSTGFSQKDKLVGSWLASEVEYDGKIEQVGWVVDFSKDGKILIMGMDYGTWAYDEKASTITLKSEFDRDFNGSVRIIKLTKKVLIYKKDQALISFYKLDYDKVAVENMNSGLSGTWEFKGDPSEEVKTYLMLKQPSEFTLIEKQAGMKSQSNGLWVFNKKENHFRLIGLQGANALKGINELIHINDKKIELSNNGKVYSAHRKEENAHGIEHLEFSENDFYTEEDDYKYNDEKTKLPWQDQMLLMMSMLEIKSLVYNHAELINGTKVFENKLLIAEVKVNPQDAEFRVDNVFVGYDKYNIPENLSFPADSHYSNALYPLEGDTYRVVGNEELTTPAGTFNCTVIEALLAYDTCQKLWMVNDKLGVYAKIIEEKKDDLYGYYHVYELQKIN